MDDYYSTLFADAAAFDLGCQPSDWYDFWHTHVDWDGRGNSTPEDRHKHLAALFTVWERVRKQAQMLERPSQTWLRIEPEDSSQDAAYLHTPNPQRDVYPHEFEDVEWGIVPPSILVPFVDDRFEVGRCEYEGVVSFRVRERGKAG